VVRFTRHDTPSDADADAPAGHPSIHPRRDATPWTADADADAARMMRDNYLHRILHRSRAVASSRRRVVARGQGGGRHPSALTRRSRRVEVYLKWDEWFAKAVFSRRARTTTTTEEDDDVGGCATR
jgi:hypothetical protein